MTVLLFLYSIFILWILITGIKGSSDEKKLKAVESYNDMKEKYGEEQAKSFIGSLSWFIALSSAFFWFLASVIFMKSGFLILSIYSIIVIMLNIHGARKMVNSLKDNKFATYILTSGSFTSKLFNVISLIVLGFFYMILIG